MKRLAFVVVALFACNGARAEEPPTYYPAPCAAPPAPATALPCASATPPLSKVQHLRAAASHLDAAGLPSEAQELRHQALEVLTHTRETLDRKIVELKKLNTEITELQSQLDNSAHIAASISLFECDDAQLKRLQPLCSPETCCENAKAKSAPGIYSFSCLSDEQARQLLAKLQECHRDGSGKILAAPTLTMAEGMPGHCHVGGEVPIVVPQSKGTVSIEFKKFGAMIDLVNLLIDEQKIHTEVRVRHTKLLKSESPNAPPNFWTADVDTGFVLESGQTIVLCGPPQLDPDAQKCCAADDESACCSDKDHSCCKADEKNACSGTSKRLLVLVRIERKNTEDRCAAAPAATQR